MVKFLLKVRFNNELLERLRGSSRLRDICGFVDGVPSESALSRFVSRLADHQPLIHECLAGATNELRRLLRPTRKQAEQGTLPLGVVTAIDSTLFPTYSNPNRSVVSDPDARWGLKNSAKAKDGKKEWMFGYKMHLLSDATYGLPLDFIVTPANESDSPMLRDVFKEARKTHRWLRPKYLLADKGYDSQANHKFLVWAGDSRKPKEGQLHDGIYDALGAPTCIGPWNTSARTRRQATTCSGVRRAAVTCGTMGPRWRTAIPRSGESRRQSPESG